MSFYLDNPFFKIILAFVPAILSISAPFILQVIGRLNDQFKSSNISNQFLSEASHKAFVGLLVLTVISTVLCFSLNIAVFVISFILTGILITVFFWYLGVLLIYQDGIRLFKLYKSRLKIYEFVHSEIGKSHVLGYRAILDTIRNIILCESINFKTLRALYNDSKDLTQFAYVLSIRRKRQLIDRNWHAIMDLYKYAISEGNFELQDNIYEFIHDVRNFIVLIESKHKKNVLFPKNFSNATYEIISTYLKTNEKHHPQPVYRFIGSIFFPYKLGTDEYPDEINPEIYNAIWRNIALVIEDGPDSILERYWSFAHQYCSLDLMLPYVNYDHSDPLIEEESKKRRDAIEIQREKFRQFHVLVSAYIFHKRRFELLKYTWYFTQSQPASYELPPRSFSEVFVLYLTFRSPYLFGSGLDGVNYSFRELSFDTLGGKRDVKSVVVEYSAYLFLRLYTIYSGNIGNPLQIPSPPIEQHVKREWIEGLNQFRDYVARSLKDITLLELLGLTKIDKEYCSQRLIAEPLDFLDAAINSFEKSFDETKSLTPLDPDKLLNLKKEVVVHADNAVQDFQRLLSIEDLTTVPAEVDANTNIAPFMGVRVPMDRETLISNASIAHMNWETVIGQILTNNFYQQFALVFAVSANKRKFKVPNGSILSAVQRLGIIKEEHVLVSFGLNLEYQAERAGISLNHEVTEADWTIDGVPIYSYHKWVPSFSNTIIALRKHDVPKLWFKDWKEVTSNLEKEKYESMDSNISMYFRIQEFNDDPTLVEKVSSISQPPESFKDKVLVSVELNGGCWLNPKSFLVQIEEGRMFQEGGKLDDIESILTFEELRTNHGNG
jgi:hypothetical protein